MKFLKYILLLLTVPVVAQDVGVHRVNIALTRGQGVQANVVPYATIRVCVTGTTCTELAPIFSDLALSQPLDQPVVADSSGNYNYYFAAGCVDEQLSTPGLGVITTPNVCMEGNGVTSIGLTMPSWLSVPNSPLSAGGTLNVIPTTGQTPHQVVGTCGTATTFAPCSLVPGDIPTLNQNTTGNAATSTLASTASSVPFSGLTGTNPFVVLAPTSNQTVAQPTGTTLAVNDLNSTTINASLYPGADVGAKINAANTAAGSGPADIVVTVAGTVSTVPTISSNHRLILAAPLTWTVSSNSGAIILQNNTQVIGLGSNAVQTVTLTSATEWTFLKNVNNVTLDNVWFVNNGVVTDQNSIIFYCQTCSNIVITNNNVFAATLVSTTTTALTYAAVTSESQLSSNIMVSGNYVNGNGNPITGAFFLYTKGVTYSHNIVINAEEAVEWWGGDANIEGRILTNPRWARDINISDSVSINTSKGSFWGDMGQDVTVTGVTVDGCGDVCLDSESSTRVVFSGFTCRNSLNGCIATFFNNIDVTFGPGTVEAASSTTTKLAIFHNQSFSATGTVGVKVHDVKFICDDPINICPIAMDPQGGFEFVNNDVLNGSLFNVAGGTANSAYRINGNTFRDTVSLGGLSNIQILGQQNDIGPNSEISGNFFYSSVTQPAGSFAINATITDPNFDDILYVTGNTTRGFTNDAKFVAASVNPGITPIFTFSNNNWGSGSVTKTIAGALGVFGGVNSTQIATASACTAGVSSTCAVALTLPLALTDVLYSAVCQVDSTTAGTLVVSNTGGKTVSGFSVNLANLSATVASTGGTVTCHVMHN